MKISIQALSIGPIATNCYIVYNEDREAFVIDPGCEWEPILKAVEDLSVTHILLTHAHWDHIGGVYELYQRYKPQIFVHRLEASWLTDPNLNLSGASMFIPKPISVPVPFTTIDGDEEWTLLGERVTVKHTPGHSPGHVSYQMGDVIFGGDVLFAGSVGRTDLPGGDHETLMASIERHFLSLPDDTVVLPGHGPSTTIGDERLRNPFLQ